MSKPWSYRVQILQAQKTRVAFYEILKHFTRKQVRWLTVFIAWINILSELRGNVREKSKNSTGKHFHQAQLCPVFHFHKNPSKSPCHCAVMAYWLAHLFFPFKLIKKPKNGLLPSFSLDFTWNRQIWLFYTEKWIFFKHLGTLLKLTKLHFRPQSPLVSGSINICRPARWDAWINLDHYVGF